MFNLEVTLASLPVSGGGRVRRLQRNLNVVGLNSMQSITFEMLLTLISVTEKPPTTDLKAFLMQSAIKTVKI